MANKDTEVLVKISDRLIAEEIQRMLEDSEIYSLLSSDNPASSAINAYFGSHPNESLDLVVNINDYQKAKEILLNSPYKDLITSI